MNPDTLSSTISSALLQTKEARLKTGDCHKLMPGLKIEGTHCFLSPVLPDTLLPLVQKAVAPFGLTPGWSNNYGGWGAFYAAKSDSKMTFGVNIVPMEDNPDFLGQPDLKEYRSFVTVVAERQ